MAEKRARAEKARLDDIPVDWGVLIKNALFKGLLYGILAGTAHLLTVTALKRHYSVRFD